MKKLLSTLTAFSLCFLLVIPAAAAPSDSTAHPSEIHFNEYDYICTLSSAVATTAWSSSPFAQDNATEIAAEFYSKLEERANESDEALLGSGYTRDEIALLRDYADGVTLTDAEMRSISGTCTGNIIATHCSDRAATFSYTWYWDHEPVCSFNDSASIRWLAYDGSAHNIGVTTSNVYTYIDYYLGNVRISSSTGTIENTLGFDAVNVQFPVNEENYNTDTGINEETYAKRGQIMVSVELADSVENSINYIMVAGLYGHSLISIGSPSISASPTGDISISFSGGSRSNPLLEKKLKSLIQLQLSS